MSSQNIRDEKEWSTSRIEAHLANENIDYKHPFNALLLNELKRRDERDAAQIAHGNILTEIRQTNQGIREANQFARWTLVISSIVIVLAAFAGGLTTNYVKPKDQPPPSMPPSSPPKQDMQPTNAIGNASPNRPLPAPAAITQPAVPGHIGELLRLKVPKQSNNANSLPTQTPDKP